jgi:glutathione peroxidase
MRALPIGLLALAAVLPRTAIADGPKDGKNMSLYDFKMKDIDGKEVSLGQYKGKVVLAVNVASKCGLTPHYAGLEKLYQKHQKDGLVILGFPANEFGAQEPGTDAEIKTFCSTKYNVTFPMFSKIVVKGEGRHPLYTWLVDSTDKKDIDWNFAKFLIGKDGKVLQRFSAKTTPEELEPAVEKVLKGN